MYRCIIIDDETHALEGLKEYIGTIPELKLIASFSDPLLALRYVQENEPVDLILLDIDMPVITGLELAKEIRSKTKKLVFTTGHSKYAYEAFEVNADAFLLKPYTLGKFVITINKLFSKQETLILDRSKEEEENFIFVKSKEDNLKLIKVNLNDIVLIESKQNYVQLNALNKNFLVYISLTELAKKIGIKKEFIQVQRSFIINKNFIEYIDGNTVRMMSGTSITVGELYRKEFKDFVTERLVKMGKKS
jgi:DNA-binding LytR/AlgR family response regulator